MSSTRLLTDAFRNAVYAYSARWLPIRSTLQRSHIDPAKAQKQQQEFRDELWHRARQTQFAAMSCPSYRSILALYLFSLTEMPLDNDDPGFSQLCTQVLLTHFGILRSPLRRQTLRALSPSTTVLPVVRDSQDAVLGSKSLEDSHDHRQMQDAMFWIGVVCDTSRSLINQVSSVLLGESGDTKVWDFILQRTVVFDQSFRCLHGSLLPLSSDIVVIILQHATACKTMYLGIINQLCDALFQHNVESINRAAERVLVESRRFHDVFDQLLSMVAGQYLTLSEESQLNYCQCSLPA